MVATAPRSLRSETLAPGVAVDLSLISDTSRIGEQDGATNTQASRRSCRVHIEEMVELWPGLMLRLSAATSTDCVSQGKNKAVDLTDTSHFGGTVNRLGVRSWNLVGEGSVKKIARRVLPPDGHAEAGTTATTAYSSLMKMLRNHKGEP